MGPCGLAAPRGVKGGHGAQRVRHLLLIAHEETGHAVLDDVREGADGERHDGRARSERLHGDERAGFGHETGNHEAAGSGQQPALAPQADGADEAAQRIEAGRDLAMEVGLVLGVAEHAAGEQQRHRRAACGVEGEVEPLVRTDAAEREREVAPAHARGEVLDGNAVLDRGEQPCARRTGCVLRPRDAVEEGVRPVGAEGLRRVEGRRQVERDQRGHTWRRQVAMEVDAVQVDEVHGALAQHRLDRGAVPLLRRTARVLAQRAVG